MFLPGRQVGLSVMCVTWAWQGKARLHCEAGYRYQVIKLSFEGLQIGRQLWPERKSKTVLIPANEMEIRGGSSTIKKILQTSFMHAPPAEPTWLNSVCVIISCCAIVSEEQENLR